MRVRVRVRRSIAITILTAITALPYRVINLSLLYIDPSHSATPAQRAYHLYLSIYLCLLKILFCLLILLNPFIFKKIMMLNVEKEKKADKSAILLALPSMAAGICSPVDSGAVAMRRKVHGFFYAHNFQNLQYVGFKIIMVGGVWGSRKACRTQIPVCKPDISSTALILIAPDGGQPPYRSTTMSDSTTRKTSLYRHYDVNNQLLYVGISVSYLDRFENHKNTSEWAFESVRMDTQWFDSREEALAAEQYAIKNEHPKFNRIHSKINRKNKVNLSTTSEIFQFQNHPLRVFTDQDGNPWFIAKDVAEILEYSDAYEMTKNLDEDEIQNRQIAGFGNRGINLINESGLYSSVFSSRKPEAKTFKRWVTHEVLSSIRKTGSYTKQPKAQKISDFSIKNQPVSSIDLKKSKNIQNSLMEYERQEMEQERLEYLERLEQNTLDSNNLSVSILRFVDDWQSGLMGAPFVPCHGEQAMNLFYRWFSENKQFEDQYAGHSSKIMTELYKHPMLYRQNNCVDKETNNHRVMTMINNQKPAEGQSIYDYVTESIQKMEQYLTKTGQGHQSGIDNNLLAAQDIGALEHKITQDEKTKGEGN